MSKKEQQDRVGGRLGRPRDDVSLFRGCSPLGGHTSLGEGIDAVGEEGVNYTY